MTSTSGVPALDELRGDWLPRAELAHLPSLRNQWGQAHANADLTSLSWLAVPPFSGGYHTGVLRLDGRVVAAESMRWAPWGVRRRAVHGQVTVTTDTRLGYESTDVWWRTTVVNPGPDPVTVHVAQELLAPVATSDTGWGWLYGTPWSAGHQHDFFATERVRAEVLADEPRPVPLYAPGARWLRLGRPRTPGIQRDEDTSPMLLDAELPDHTSPDAARPRPDAARVRVRLAGREFELTDPHTEFRLDPVTLADLPPIEVLVEDATSGVVLTHGNHPDSAQLGLDEGRPWLRIGGEHASGPDRLTPGAWHQLRVEVDAAGARLIVDGASVAATRPWWDGQRWTASVEADTVVVTDSASACAGVYAFATAPDELIAQGSRGTASWRASLAPGETVQLGVVLRLGVHAADAARQAMAHAAGFAARFDAIADRWRRTWAAAFTPGNDEFSGHLPTLVTEDSGLARTYYLGALLAVYLRNTGVSPIGPVFLTGGPRLGPTITFYWDQSEFARTAALLEPAGMRAWILAALAQPYDRSHSFDTRNLLPVGNHYAANDHALFRTVQAYVGVTADLGLLREQAGGGTVLDHVRAMAYRHRDQRAAFGAGVLADYGRDAWELLECVPNYRDAVVSFNAGQVGMLRAFAHLLRLLDQPEEAASADADATELSAAVLGQYAPGGRWRTAHPEGDETIGHCLDFALVTADMGEDLSEPRRSEMVDFVTGHLLDGDWMRALAPDDPVAPHSDRPDHGAAGAFCAWPGATAYGLCRLGRPDLAQQLLGRLHAATSGGLWGQAMEAVGGGRFRVAERGVANRDSNAGVAATEAVIAGLFGIHAGYADLTAPTGSLTSAAGELRHVNAHGFAGELAAAVGGAPWR
ncbi:hypothetical protein [Catellatospora tritici]|uniref:hypothetical protein n=1 Tax=Catellatospora tritici TaxID=2851566 RepID=UPI001C2D5D7F|nr:hypothetical protein [Catellatospora tritici]MBV1852831.1 hypothetical protein [Catellatospora tritici]